MTPCRSRIVTVPVCTTRWPGESLLAGISVPVPFSELCSRAETPKARRSAVNTAPVIFRSRRCHHDSRQGSEHAPHCFRSNSGTSPPPAFAAFGRAQLWLPASAIPCWPSARSAAACLVGGAPALLRPNGSREERSAATAGSRADSAPGRCR